MPMGPITLYDVVGLDTCYHAGHVMKEAFPDRVVESPLLVALYKAGRYGQKSGAGFFAYSGKSEHGQPDPALADILAPLVRKKEKLSDEQIVHRLFLPMVLEASRILAEKKVANARDVDLGLVFGTGFPPFKGGLLFWADTIGAAKIVALVKPLEGLGERYRPPPLLLELAKSGRGFYD
jgi:3-hydroxyacyl-CoA dehydrogenase/enoyl-CoA hydratase/3-hydroxybutyryl-CoA epimerase/3-hydroxyacyl-CoA dehydrogenase/enoyl-CoA hydratase/3-hydroxybutyryl-CoA epimerase/enoyl-CoA isomerase